jgi:hypothetical protein
MRQAFLYYMVQTWAANPHQQAPRDEPPQAPAPAAPAGGMRTPRRVIGAAARTPKIRAT